jgi:hypothetical protein
MSQICDIIFGTDGGVNLEVINYATLSFFLEYSRLELNLRMCIYLYGTKCMHFVVTIFIK